MTNNAQAESLDPVVDLAYIGSELEEDDWLVSEWNAGQSRRVQWHRDNVRTTEEGFIELVLDNADPGDGSRELSGGEIQSVETATTGNWAWSVQAPEMVEGAVFGLFLYQADWQNDPRLEFDFEFVGEDTTRVQLNIHMDNEDGERITLKQGNGNENYWIDLGFDASEGVHDYGIELTEYSAIFRVDGDIVAEFTAADMPGNFWRTGEVKGFADLWAVSGYWGERWAGEFEGLENPLVALIEDVRTPSEEVQEVSAEAWFSTLVGDLFDFNDILNDDVPVVLASEANDREPWDNLYKREPEFSDQQTGFSEISHEGCGEGLTNETDAWLF